MNRIILVENQINQLSISDSDVISGILEISRQAKEYLGLPKDPISLVTGSSMYVNGIICNVSLGNLNLVILPKINRNPDDSNAYKAALDVLLNRTMLCARDRISSVVYFSHNTVVDDQNIFIEALARFYAESLSLALNKSIITTYQLFENKTDNIRGRILLRKQLSEPMTDARLWCRYRRFSNNNMFNSLLLWACRYLTNLTTNGKIKRQLLNLARHFSDADMELSYQTVSKMILPRQFLAFSECFAIAKDLYLSNKGRKESNAYGKKICGYVISTERAFESIVEYYCRNAARHLGYSFRTQAQTQFAYSLQSSQFDYSIIPDDIVFTNDACLVLDAKYKVIAPFNKRYNNRPNREDLYQIVCSCIAHRAHEAILVYPLTDASIPMSWEMVEKINGQRFMISSGFIDIYGSDKLLDQSFIELLRNTEFYEVTKYGTNSAS